MKYEIAEMAKRTDGVVRSKENILFSGRIYRKQYNPEYMFEERETSVGELTGERFIVYKGGLMLRNSFAVENGEEKVVDKWFCEWLDEDTFSKVVSILKEYHYSIMESARDLVVGEKDAPEVSIILLGKEFRTNLDRFDICDYRFKYPDILRNEICFFSEDGQDRELKKVFQAANILKIQKRIGKVLEIYPAWRYSGEVREA